MSSTLAEGLNPRDKKDSLSLSLLRYTKVFDLGLEFETSLLSLLMVS